MRRTAAAAIKRIMSSEENTLPPPAEQRTLLSRLRGRTIALGIALLVAVFVAGSPGLDSPWIQGDEYIFIAANPDVNPQVPGVPADRGLGARLAAIATKVHDDLYQPVPILTYAIEWSLTGGSPLSFRRTDLLIHALNALLLWWVLARVLVQVAGGRAAPVTDIAWLLALLWALHPMLVTTYAADMGRTHLLSATFSLLALGFYVRSLKPGQAAYFFAALAALILAMLSKPVPGWVLVALVLEAARRGWLRALVAPQVWAVGIVCVGFALATLWTSQEAGMLEDTSKGLFGGPITRSGLALWIYARNAVAPLWLAFWYPPDPRTGWGYPLVWAGLALAAASVLLAVWAWRQAATRAVTLGWAWCWALLLPVLGLVAARELAAGDRYFYQPLMGVMLIVGVVIVRWTARSSPGVVMRVLWPVAIILALAMLLWDLPQARLARSTIGRAARLVELNPSDPRALEALAQAYDFARNHELPASERAALPSGTDQFEHFNALVVETFTRAATVPDLASWFPGPDDEAPFHRRLAFRFQMAGAPEQALAQAEEAKKLRPDDYMTWTRLAHAYQALGRLDEAEAAYLEAESRLPDRPETQAVHLTDYANLLMFDLERDAEACPRFAAALQTGFAPPAARLGMALCMIRDRSGTWGTGAQGYQLVSEYLAADPGNVRAGLVLAEYHLRSHHWEQAWRVYDAILRDQPTNYTALRGYHEVCQQMKRPLDAALAWADAAQLAPASREYRSYLVWAVALAGKESARERAEALLKTDIDNPLACFALALEALRAHDPQAAVAYVDRARNGTPVPKAREFERAAAAFRLLVSRDELPAEASLVEAALYLDGPAPDGMSARVGELLDTYLAQHPDSPHLDLAESLRARLSDVKAGP